MILQNTGFGAALPTGEGLFAFTNLDEAAEAVRAVQADPARHRDAANELAREYLSHEVVLGNLLDHVGLRPRAGRPTPRTSPARAELPETLPLNVSSRDPLELDDETSRYVLGRPIPAAPAPAAPPIATVVVPVRANLACTRLALESVLANTDEPPYEIVVVDKGSEEVTRTYLEALAARNRHLRIIRADDNLGFAAARNRGLAAAHGETLVMLQDDLIVPPRWLPDLAAHLEDPAIGLVVPATNHSPGGAQVPTSYTTYGEMVRFARQRREELAEIPLETSEPPTCSASRCAAVSSRRSDHSTSGSIQAASRTITPAASATQATGFPARTTSSPIASARVSTTIPSPLTRPWHRESRRLCASTCRLGRPFWS